MDKEQNENRNNFDDAGKNSLREFLAALMGGEAADQALAALENSGFDAAQANLLNLPLDGSTVQMFIAQAQQLLNHSEAGAVNWEVAEQVAKTIIWRQGQRLVSAAKADVCRQALGEAELWLDVVTDFVPAAAEREVWNAETWLKQTLPAWKQLLNPVCQAICQSFTATFVDRVEQAPPEIAAYAQAMMGDTGMAAKMIGAVYGQQMGELLGKIAQESCTSFEIGMPLLENPGLVLLPENIEKFASGLDIPVTEVRAFWALREAAYARLHARAPWIRLELLKIIHRYAQNAQLDLERMQDLAEKLQNEPMVELDGTMTENLFALKITAAQENAQSAAVTLLALVEGWVQQVTLRAGLVHLPHIMPLLEMFNRWQAQNSPAALAFKVIIGASVPPRKLRNALKFWQVIEAAKGQAGRDDLWSHPDLLPTARDLSDPQGYLARQAIRAEQDARVDAELAALLDGSLESLPDLRNADDFPPPPDGSDSESGQETPEE